MYLAYVFFTLVGPRPKYVMCDTALCCHPQRVPAIVAAFNDNNVSFMVRGGLQVLVLLADPNAGTQSVNGV